jgi:predicted glycoside hydrolase/deacetylase ChbG (UPF0249 family)
MRRLIVCADDFGMSPGVSEAIAELAEAGKVNAISCMAISQRWEEDAALLKNLPTSVQLGLHLVLTDERPLTSAESFAPSGRMPSAGKLGRMALLRRLPAHEIAMEVSAQFDEFIRVLGRLPSFVDSHQHTHVLPILRDIVVNETLWRAPAAWIRSCEDRAARILRRPFPLKALVNSIQSRAVRRAASRARIAFNDSFSGLYDFQCEYAELFPRFISNPGGFHLVICHPGGAPAEGDRIAPARVREASALRVLHVARLADASGLSFG